MVSRGTHRGRPGPPREVALNRYKGVHGFFHFVSSRLSGA